MTRECLDYDSKVVGGVTPGRGGRDVYGVPVYDTIKEIVAKEKVDGSVITVPAPFVRTRRSRRSRTASSSSSSSPSARLATRWLRCWSSPGCTARA